MCVCVNAYKGQLRFVRHFFSYYTYTDFSIDIITSMNTKLMNIPQLKVVLVGQGAVGAMDDAVPEHNLILAC